MARISDVIEGFLKQLINDSQNKTVEIQRNELARYFDCAPSQINYVLMTRFNYVQGYYIESQRGGGGYIKIKKLLIDTEEDIYTILLREIGNSITNAKANRIIESLYDREIISGKEARIIKAATGDAAILSPLNIKDQIRANILKNILAVILG